MRTATMVIDLQFGSTGKGLLVGYLAKRNEYDTIVTAWAPNAGHTFIEADGTKHVRIQLGNGTVSPKLKRVLIGPGSLIDVDQLLAEVAEARINERGIILAIHENAGIVLSEHREVERRYGYKIGSTMKGCGEALISKIRRNGMITAKGSRELIGYVVSGSLYQKLLGEAENVLIEGSQGFSLSIHHGFYPYTTSRDVSPAQVLSDCGIPIRGFDLMIWGTARTFPIRVANRFDDSGLQIGTSGPCYDDQYETGWDILGLEPEYTTVTKLKRRVFSFSNEQMRQALRICTPDAIFLNFLNYLPYEDRFTFVERVNRLGVEAGVNGIVKMVGLGSSEKNVHLVHYSENYTVSPVVERGVL